MELKLPTAEQIPTSESTSTEFVVQFSDPSRWARLGAQQRQPWKLVGKGKLILDGESVVLRGRARRPFWFSRTAEIRIPRADVMNVAREGALVQCHVRDAGATRVLKVWSINEAAAEELVQALPHERTSDFAQQLAEHGSFAAALAALGTRPVVTPALVVANCVVFACTVYAGAGFFQPDGLLLVRWGTNFGPRTLDGEWWRLFTSMFVHFGVLHLALNMWALWGIGQLTEKLYGSAYFLVLYVFAGLSGSLLSLYWHPNLNSAGASGAIFGVIGGLLAFMVNPKTRIPASVAAVHRKSAGVFILYNLLNGFAHAGIDNAAHIGGLVGGFGIGWILARPVDVEQRSDPLRRLAAGVLLGAVVFTAALLPLSHPSPTVAAEHAFRYRFELFAQDESQAIAGQRALQELVSSKKITEQEWARRTTTEIIPKWQAAEAEIAAVQLPAQSHLLPLRVALLEYLDERRFGLELLSDAVRFNDREKLERGARVIKRNNARAEEIKALIGRVY